MGSLAVFGITSDGANLVVSLLILLLVVFWFALVYWTYSDACRRIEDPLLVGCATAASLFPFAGTVVYMIVRPPEYLDDVRERQLEIAAAEARLASMDHLSCPYCNFDVERSFLRCPSCLRRLKEPCGTCGKPLDPRWKICPYCEADIGQPQPQPQRRQRRRERAPASGAQRAAAGQRQAAAAPESQRQTAAASESQRQAAAERAGQTGSPARRAAARPARAPAGEPREPDPAAARPPTKAPRNADGTRAERARTARESAEGAEAKRPQRPQGARGQKRSSARNLDQPITDGAPAEPPVTRPRTRPPSAG